ncbi:MAG: HupE/UreJ family protein [Oceanospirillum sp.]|nr:HupE/UreJ family protein [Oceanospirillum sp.]
MPGRVLLLLSLFCLESLFSPLAFAHGVGSQDGAFIEQTQGAAILPFIYLGAKHMVTGYDHLLFLLGVIFLLYRSRDVAITVSLFALGHSMTLVMGVLAQWQVNPWLIDALIGLSVVYKGLDNLGAYNVWFRVQPDIRWAVFLFGLVHGLGLATKLQEYSLNSDGLFANLIAFNIGVELGQALALILMLAFVNLWRSFSVFNRQSVYLNLGLICLGFLLAGYQLSGFVIEGGV